MITRLSIFILLLRLGISEFCGSNKIPYGIEFHKSGTLTLLCSRPNCHEKKYAECPERAEEASCPQNTTWVGGLERRIDGSVKLMCCDYELLGKYGEIIYKNVIIRAGEYFEAEEKTDINGEEVISFDLISNILRKRVSDTYRITLPLWQNTEQGAGLGTRKTLALLEERTLETYQKKLRVSTGKITIDIEYHLSLTG